MVRFFKQNIVQVGFLIFLYQIWIFVYAGIDHIVNYTLYLYGLEFSYEWADPYWILMAILVFITALLCVRSYWIKRDLVDKNYTTAFKIGFILIAEWIGGIFDTVFFIIHGSFPPPEDIWWWMIFYRWFNIPWNTYIHLIYNGIWIGIIVGVWLITRYIRKNYKV